MMTTLKTNNVYNHNSAEEIFNGPILATLVNRGQKYFNSPEWPYYFTYSSKAFGRSAAIGLKPVAFYLG
jgi:hypothetical protein